MQYGYGLQRKVIYESIKFLMELKLEGNVLIKGFRNLPTSKHHKKNLKNIFVARN